MSLDTQEQPPAGRIVLTYEDSQIYARHSVRHYWLVDPDAHAIETFELGGEGYHPAGRAAGETTFAPSLFPGLTISLSSLWG
jgi:Uma2 family endonuclease